ncbi:hypothetical protein OUZ56_032494 [Daphnia magna]|uniref:POTRA domain-containing protein n=1 Tax=Daphnia magna TaxID=35525 RepID=A0ABR0B930_9CRUS|nr:hypothetical protein OUZ56_032494 [Daphnia magna]
MGKRRHRERRRTPGIDFVQRGNAGSRWRRADLRAPRVLAERGEPKRCAIDGGRRKRRRDPLLRRMQAPVGLHTTASVDRRPTQEGGGVLESATRVSSQLPRGERLSLRKDDKSPLPPVPAGGGCIAPPVAVDPDCMCRSGGERRWMCRRRCRRNRRKIDRFVRDHRRSRQHPAGAEEQEGGRPEESSSPRRIGFTMAPASGTAPVRRPPGGRGLPCRVHPRSGRAPSGERAPGGGGFTDRSRRLVRSPGDRSVAKVSRTLSANRLRTVPFSSLVLSRDLERIERFYRARGFLDAQVRAARVEERDETHVVVTIEIHEGLPTTIATSVVEEGGALLATADRAPAAPEDRLAKRLARTVRRSAAVGARFDEDDGAATEEALRRNLEDAGRGGPLRSPAGTEGDSRRILLEIGDTHADHLRVARAALGLEVGALYTRSSLDEARRALLDLGPFATGDVEPVRAATVPTEAEVRVAIRVTARLSKLRAVRFGGGLELDVIRTDLHGLMRWENKDFFGAYRTFSIDTRPGVVLYPTRIPDFQKPERLLVEAKVRASLASPAFFEGRTVGTARVEYNVFPVLLSSTANAATVLGYQELRANVGVERPFGRFFLAPGYGIQANFPFAYVGERDPDLSPVLLLYPTIVAQYDLRDSKVSPHRGAFFSLDIQAAGLPAGSALDLRIAPEARGYIPLGRRTTLALRGAFGFLAPSNYGDTLRENASGSGPPDGVSRARWVRDVQLTYLRAFFGGGPNSNRGYPLRGIGPTVSSRSTARNNRRRRSRRRAAPRPPTTRRSARNRSAVCRFGKRRRRFDLSSSGRSGARPSAMLATSVPAHFLRALTDSISRAASACATEHRWVRSALMSVRAFPGPSSLAVRVRAMTASPGPSSSCRSRSPSALGKRFERNIA